MFSCLCLSDTELCTQVEEEALALVIGLKRFHQYLYECKFTLITDHKGRIGNTTMQIAYHVCLSTLPLEQKHPEVLSVTIWAKSKLYLSLQQKWAVVQGLTLRRADYCNQLVVVGLAVFPSDLKPFYSWQKELTVEGDNLLWGVRVVVRAKLKSQIL